MSSILLISSGKEVISKDHLQKTLHTKGATSEFSNIMHEQIYGGE